MYTARFTLSIFSIFFTSNTFASAITADGFGTVIQKAVESREAQFLSSSAGRAVATGAQAGAMGIALAASAEIIKQHPEVIDSYRMCGEATGNVQLCTSSSVFAAASFYAAGKYGDSVGNGLSSFGRNLVNGTSATWGLVGNAAGLVGIADLAIKNGSKQIKYFTDGVKLSDGTYNITLPDGSVINTRSKPSAANPVAVSLNDGYQSYSAEGVKSQIDNYSKTVKPEKLPDTFYNVPAPPPVSQSLPEGVSRVSVRGTSTPYYFDGRDESGDFTLTGTNPALIGLYSAINNFIKPNVYYYESQDDFNQHIKIPQSFKTYVIKLKDFQYSDYSIISGGYPTSIKVVYTVTETSVRLTNSRDICQSEKVQTGGTDAKPVYSYKTRCVPSKAQYSKTERSYDTVINTVFFNSDYDTSTSPKLVDGSVIDDIGGYNGEAPPVGTASQLAGILNGMAGQVVTGETYKGIPLDRPFTASEIAAAANAAGVPLNPGIMYQPVTLPSVWTNAIPKDHPHDKDSDYDDDSPSIDLGENPNIKSPELEKPPTGQEILQPIIDLMPFVKDINVSAKDVQCPKWNFEIWDKSYSVDSHCSLLEKIRTLLKAVFLLIWGIVSLRIILSA